MYWRPLRKERYRQSRPGESAYRHIFASAEGVARLGVADTEALAYTHRCGLLHRNIEPSNIFVGEDGAITLGDFGLACLAADKLSDRSGLPARIAPFRPPAVTPRGLRLVVYANLQTNV